LVDGGGIGAAVQYSIKKIKKNGMVGEQDY
jgi:hypothetical protein